MYLNPCLVCLVPARSCVLQLPRIMHWYQQGVLRIVSEWIDPGHSLLLAGNLISKPWTTSKDISRPLKRTAFQMPERSSLHGTPLPSHHEWCTHQLIESGPYNIFSARSVNISLAMLGRRKKTSQQVCRCCNLGGG